MRASPSIRTDAVPAAFCRSRCRRAVMTLIAPTFFYGGDAGLTYSLAKGRLHLFQAQVLLHNIYLVFFRFIFVFCKVHLPSLWSVVLRN